jgi:CheY-like chemotaxis protein
MGNPVPKILVADDNSNIQKMVALAFEDRGVRVVAVGNGEAAVRRMPELVPDLVLADIFMPVRNGYEVCEFIKKDERFSHIPVILLVGAFDPLDEKEARRVGADGILKKPFVPPDPLIAMVMSALEKNPRVAAELAKAREAKEAPEPHPLPQLEIPARPMPKPLPQFPEPSPEEAAAAYGFSAGASKPAFVDEVADDTEFEGAATISDWRRSAMDFEIPAEAANMPAFSSDDDLTPIAAPQPEQPSEPVVALDHAVETDALVQSPGSSEIDTLSDNFFEPEAPSLVPAPVPVENVPESPLHEQWLTPSRSDASPVSERQSEAHPNSTLSQPHWMDAVAASKSEYPHRDWMSTLAEQTANAAPSDAVEHPADEIQTQPHSRGEEPFFADEALPIQAARDFFPSEQPASTGWSEQEAKPFESSAGIGNLEVEADPEPTQEHAFAFKDPALVEPPAVRVTPEPLLIDEDPRPSPEYGSRMEELTPLHSFVVPGADETVAEESAAQESPVQDEALAPSFEPLAPEINERIPTGPPPNREALSEIPFLVPPLGFRPDAPEEPAVNSETVDAVVRKVLEKLEPQLHDLLSQGVLKPLVENLLQAEIARKEK